MQTGLTSASQPHEPAEDDVGAVTHCVPDAVKTTKKLRVGPTRATAGSNWLPGTEVSACRPQCYQMGDVVSAMSVIETRATDDC